MHVRVDQARDQYAVAQVDHGMLGVVGEDLGELPARDDDVVDHDQP